MQHSRVELPWREIGRERQGLKRIFFLKFLLSVWNLACVGQPVAELSTESVGGERHDFLSKWIKKDGPLCYVTCLNDETNVVTERQLFCGITCCSGVINARPYHKVNIVALLWVNVPVIHLNCLPCPNLYCLVSVTRHQMFSFLLMLSPKYFEFLYCIRRRVDIPSASQPTTFFLTYRHQCVFDIYAVL